MSLRKIRLELARNPDFPDGSPNHGYAFNLPLRDDGHVDETALEADSSLCTVVRFWGDEDDEHGLIIKTADGSWAFSYAPGEDDDEPIFRLTGHLFLEGEYISVTEHDGVNRTFRVVSIGPAHHIAPD